MNGPIGNVRAFRAEFESGNVVFEHKTEDGRGSMACGSVSSLASNVRSEVDFLLKSGYSVVSIDFTPFHNIECPKGLAPHRCFPLTPEEQAEFWSHYVKK